MIDAFDYVIVGAGSDMILGNSALEPIIVPELV